MDIDKNKITKICPKCKQSHPFGNFYKSSKTKDGMSCWCKGCKRKASKSLAERYEKEIGKNGVVVAPKKCSQCHENKTIDHFGNRQTSKDGKSSVCKSCKKKKDKIYYEQNRDQIKEYHRDYYRENKDKCALLNKKYIANNRERVRKYQRQYRDEHKSDASAYHKQYYEKHQEKLKNRAKKNGPVWMKNNPEKVRAKWQRRRAREVNAEGSYTAEEWIAVCDKYGWLCLSCGTHNDESPLTVDHVIPLSKRGSNYISNIQNLCLYCNQSKGVKKTDYRLPENMHPNVIAFLNQT